MVVGQALVVLADCSSTIAISTVLSNPSRKFLKVLADVMSRPNTITLGRKQIVVPVLSFPATSIKGSSSYLQCLAYLIRRARDRFIHRISEYFEYKMYDPTLRELLGVVLNRKDVINVGLD